LVLAVACTDDDGQQSPVSSGGPTAAAEDGPLRVVSTAPAVEVRATAWSYARLVAPAALDIHYLAGMPDCDLLANVRVAESAEAVTVTVFSGMPADHPRSCGLVGVTARTRVTLRAPLGTRPVLDGHATPPAPREVRG
jgi:hypothetical protein